MKNVVKPEKKLNQRDIKRSNRAAILGAFRNGGEMTKLELARMLGISITTVTTNINRLLELGFIEEASIAESTGGRKPVVLRFIKDAFYTIGVDISPSRVRLMAANLVSEILLEDSFEIDLSKCFDEILSQLADRIRDLDESLGLGKEKCLGVGISLPGVVDESARILVNAPNSHIENYSFQDFENQLGRRVYVENEANIAAFNELILGHASENENVVYVSITGGIGTGIIAAGKIFKSTGKRAGEFGHMRISGQRKLCNCGRMGCWETFSSENALKDMYEVRTGKRSGIEDMFSDSKVMGEIMPDYYKYLGYGLENVALSLDPEVIIIGGAISRHLENLDENIGFESSFMTKSMPKLVLSDFGDHGSLYGASLMPLVEIFGL